jgi:hypothetical protein
MSGILSFPLETVIGDHVKHEEKTETNQHADNEEK